MEFSIDLVDPGYRELLDDPDSPQYVDLAHHLQEQVRLVTGVLRMLIWERSHSNVESRGHSHFSRENHL